MIQACHAGFSSSATTHKQNIGFTREEERLEESRLRTVHWKRWGPYLSERQWGTVREDYGGGGDAWGYLPHDHARSRAYRWGEDGIGGICDRHQYICFAIALWNGRDRILKERLFGLAGNEGNHAEDVKEYYFYLDSTPTHSYMKFLYKYPQQEFPYRSLVDENGRRTRNDPEFELIDSGVFDEYAKVTHEDILIRIKAYNRGPEAEDLHVLPTVWFRNTWSWGRDDRRPKLWHHETDSDSGIIALDHAKDGPRWLHCEGDPKLLFTENESNRRLLWNAENRSPYVKDAFHRYLIDSEEEAVNPGQQGTKAAAVYQARIEPGDSAEWRLRLTNTPPEEIRLHGDFEAVFHTRREEADEFFAKRVSPALSVDGQHVQRQAAGGTTVEQAALPLRRTNLGFGRPRQSSSFGWPQTSAQP